MGLPERGTIQRIAVKLKPAAERMVKKRHPWIFEGSIIKQSAEGKAGDLVIVFDQKKNKFLACGFYDPDSPIKVKLLQFHQSATIDGPWFVEKIAQAYALRQPLLATDTNSYRFISGENDGMPGLIADVYDQVLVLKLYSGIWFPYLSEILPALVDASGCKTVVLRLSRKLSEKRKAGDLVDGEVIYGVLEQEVVIFREHGLRFAANVVHGHKTGYFLDHRNNRKKIGQLSNDKTVLDVFAYAGGFSVHALAGGAQEVTSIDISSNALKMAQKNAELNSHQGIHHTKTVDAFAELEAMEREGQSFDVVVIDPPSFAKKASEIEGAKEQYRRLANLGARLVSPNGLLFLASCSSRVSADEFFELCEDGIQDSNEFFQFLEKTFHDVDHPIGFPEGAYLKAGYWRKR